ncbi:hypothetical protein Bca4012_022349 [Brassica carinata]
MGFSMFFSSGNDVFHHHSSPNASVDCTLSLGTPSTRLCSDDDDRRFSTHTSNNISNALGSWELLNGGKKGGGGGRNNILAHRCVNCDTTSTPLWRNGPRGPKSLCNACGIRFKKEERRASVAGNSTSGGALTASGVLASDHHGVPYYSPANSEYSFVDDVSNESHDVTTDPFLSWRLNLADRTRLVHDFTM